jgi:putative CocE/NonD family hydrolase
VLAFTSDVLADDVEVTGPVMVTLSAATSATDTDFTAKLIDVWPDGRAMSVVDGIVRARFRHGGAVSEPVTPGIVERYDIDLGPTSQVFRAGHRIRLDVSSSNFPRYDRNSNSGISAGAVTADDLIAALQTVHHATDHPSFVVLPIIPRTPLASSQR